MKIGIIGSRRRDTIKDLDLTVFKFFEIYKDGDTIVSGGCSAGGDKFAEFIAKNYQIPIMIYYARWNKYGGRAGYIRNIDIARESDVLIACVAPDRIGGTEHTIKKYLEFGKQKIILL